MATPYSPAALPYQPTTPISTTNPIGFNNTSDPRKLAESQRQLVQGQGDAFINADTQLANQYAQQATGVQQYLNPTESTLAQGGGGYNPQEAAQIQLSSGDKSQIELSPQDAQNIITGAGISAGANTASSVGAAERAAAAAGGNPAALAAYRARAAQTQGAASGDAMTNARVAAKQAEAQGASTAQQLQSAGGQAVGNARLGQQAQGLGYYTGLEQQANQNSLANQGLAQGAYGTQTQGTGQAAGLGVQASQTPSTLDKVVGGVAGAASAFLEDGTSSYLSDGLDAVLGENGPEVIVEHASDPDRSHTKFMDDGDTGGDTGGADLPYQGASLAPNAGAVQGPSFGKQLLNNYLTNSQKPAAPAAQAAPAWNPTTPWQQLGSAVGGGAKEIAGMLDNGTAGVPQPPSAQQPPPIPSWLQLYLATVAKDNTSNTAQQQQPQWNKTTPYSEMGSAIGAIGKKVAQGGLGSLFRPGQNTMGGPGAVTPGGLPSGSSGLNMAPFGSMSSVKTVTRGLPGSYAPGSGQMPEPGAPDPAPYRMPTSTGLPGMINRTGAPINGVPSYGTLPNTPPLPPSPAPDMSESPAPDASTGLFADGTAAYMADGGFPADEPGLPKAPTFNPSKLITSPTRVHLDKGDQVVPLSYRPQAKVRPSAALPALENVRMAPRLRETYGASRAV